MTNAIANVLKSNSLIQWNSLFFKCSNISKKSLSKWFSFLKQLSNFVLLKMDSKLKVQIKIFLSSPFSINSKHTLFRNLIFNFWSRFFLWFRIYKNKSKSLTLLNTHFLFHLQVSKKTLKIRFSFFLNDQFYSDL